MAETQTLAQLQLWRSEAETARHRLALGESAVRISFATDADSQTVEYRNSIEDVSRLEAYIADLTNRIDALEQDRPKRGPLYLEF